MTKIFTKFDGDDEVTPLWHYDYLAYCNEIRQTVDDQWDELGGGKATPQQIRDYINAEWKPAIMQDLDADIPDWMWKEYIDDIIKEVENVYNRNCD